jgi:hypothetical protein
MVVVWLKKRRQKANHIGGARFRFPSLYESLDSSKSSSSFSYFYSKFLFIPSKLEKKTFGRNLVDGSTGCLAPAIRQWRARDRRPFRSIHFASLFLLPCQKGRRDRAVEVSRKKSPLRMLFHRLECLPFLDESSAVCRSLSYLSCPAAGREEKQVYRLALCLVDDSMVKVHFIKLKPCLLRHAVNISFFVLLFYVVLFQLLTGQRSCPLSIFRRISILSSMEVTLHF